jgi:hypothetical protein
MTRKHGRGRTLSGMSLIFWTRDLLAESEVLAVIKSFEYKKGVAKEKELYRRLKKRGLTEKDIKKSLGSLIREGEVYSPREEWYRRTSYRSRKRERR